VSYDEPTCVDEAAPKKDAPKKTIFAEDLKVMMLAFTQALPKFNKQSGRVICVNLLFSGLQ
jgi:hypothetical protein